MQHARQDYQNAVVDLRLPAWRDFFTEVIALLQPHCGVTVDGDGNTTGEPNEYDGMVEVISTVLEGLGDSKGIPDEEPVFLLRAQDLTAAGALQHWLGLNARHGADADLYQQAKQQFNRFMNWPVKKMPDGPAT